AISESGIRRAFPFENPRLNGGIRSVYERLEYDLGTFFINGHVTTPLQCNSLLSPGDTPCKPQVCGGREGAINRPKPHIDLACAAGFEYGFSVIQPRCLVAAPFLTILPNSGRCFDFLPGSST